MGTMLCSLWSARLVLQQRASNTTQRPTQHMVPNGQAHSLLSNTRSTTETSQNQAWRGMSAASAHGLLGPVIRREMRLVDLG